MVTVLVYTRPTWWQRLRGQRGAMRVVLGLSIAGLRLVVDATSAGGVRISERVPWQEGARLIAEFVLPSPPHVINLLRDTRGSKHLMAAAVLMYLRSRCGLRWDELEARMATPKDVLAACYATYSVARLAP